MSSQPLGKCVVCGEDSHLRCGECAKHGTQLFFCGAAHQRSIWFLHRKFCGKFSNPFTFPGLSNREVEEMVKLFEKPSWYHPENRAHTWSEVYMKRNGFRDPAAALRSFKRSLDAIRDTRDVRNLQKAIIDTRRSAFQFRFGAQEIALGHSIPPQIEFATYLKTPVDYLIERVDSMMVSEILGAGNFPWRTTFLNLFSIITAGSLTIASSGFGLVEATVTEDEIVYALYRMKQFLIDNVASTRPDIVHAMMKNLPPIPDNKFELQ